MPVLLNCSSGPCREVTMIVKAQILRLFGNNEQVVKVIRKAEFTKEDIAEILLENKDIAYYCEVSDSYRLHSDLYHGRTKPK